MEIENEIRVIQAKGVDIATIKKDSDGGCTISLVGEMFKGISDEDIEEWMGLMFEKFLDEKDKL